jgi:hypothetical protein
MYHTGKNGHPETLARHETLDAARNRLDYIENNVDPEGIARGDWYLDVPQEES